MPTRNISLTEELNRYVEQSVQSGSYDNASEVIRAALRSLRQAEEEDRAKVESLRTAIQEGFDSGIYEGDIEADMRAFLQKRAAQTEAGRVA